MLFFWDPEKAEENLKKHGVSFEVAQTVFDDPFQLSVLDKKQRHEERWITVGRTPHEKTLVVVHTYSEAEAGREVIRIISARKATKREVNQYEERV